MFIPLATYNFWLFIPHLSSHGMGLPSPKNSFSNTLSPFPIKDKSLGVSLVGQWLRPCLPMQGVQVQPLVGELRSHMPFGQKPKHKTSNTVANSIKSVKMAHIKSLKKKKKRTKFPTLPPCRALSNHVLFEDMPLTQRLHSFIQR